MRGLPRLYFHDDMFATPDDIAANVLMTSQRHQRLFLAETRKYVQAADRAVMLAEQGAYMWHRAMRPAIPREHIVAARVDRQWAEAARQQVLLLRKEARASARPAARARRARARAQAMRLRLRRRLCPLLIPSPARTFDDDLFQYIRATASSDPLPRLLHDTLHCVTLADTTQPFDAGTQIQQSPQAADALPMEAHPALSASLSAAVHAAPLPSLLLTPLSCGQVKRRAWLPHLLAGSSQADSAGFRQIHGDDTMDSVFDDADADLSPQRDVPTCMSRLPVDQNNRIE